MQAEISYELSKVGQKASLLAGGDGKRQQVAVVEITDAELGLCNVEHNGKVTYRVMPWQPSDALITSFADVLNLEKSYADEKAAHDAKMLAYQEQQVLDTIAKGQKCTYRRYDTVSIDERFAPALIAAAKAFNAEAARLTQEKDAREAAEREAKQTAETAEREQYKADRAVWIAAHGSEYLKLATTNGYNCERKYVEERVALEFPGFDVDFDDNAEWKSRSCPSAAALKEAIAINSRVGSDLCQVVWLTEAPLSNSEKETYTQSEYDFEACEALIISKFLNKFDLVKAVE